MTGCVDHEAMAAAFDELIALRVGDIARFIGQTLAPAGGEPWPVS